MGVCVIHVSMRLFSFPLSLCLGMLGKTVPFIALFPRHDCFLQSRLFCQVFLRAVRLSHLCAAPDPFSRPHRATDGLSCARFSFSMHIQTTGACDFESNVCLLDLALNYYEDICHLGSSETLSPRHAPLLFRPSHAVVH